MGGVWLVAFLRWADRAAGEQKVVCGRPPVDAGGCRGVRGRRGLRRPVPGVTLHGVVLRMGGRPRG